MKRVMLSHGGGGEEMEDLIAELFYRHFGNEILLRSEDAAVVCLNGKTAFTTDSFTVSPIVFAGGDIGKIAIAGTVNDLAMMGAKPLYLSCGFMIEEGMEYDLLESIVISMRDELAVSGAKIVCGDTKVVPKGSLDQIFINTSGIGEIILEGISAHAISQGDVVLVSRDIGAHGAAILASREGIDLQSNLQSDCATLWAVVEKLIEQGIAIKAMRDATRGGLAAVLNEWAKASAVCLEIDEASLPISDEVRGICEMMGFEPYDLANEGTFVLAVDAGDSDRTLEILASYHPNASIIGEATSQKIGRVILRSPWESMRYLEVPKGELLPRIC